MTYFGTKISNNISRREPEGYLLCLNVPVARTGIQEYLPEEIGLPPGRDLIPVYRPEEEVFSPACIASFEGMPVTDDHPAFAEGVNKDNIRYLQKGHAHNIRRGEEKESDLLLADLIITDPGLSEEIMNGKREISCGYNYTLCEEDGKYVQRDIRGNHIAVVDSGRAGPRVAIRDHAGKKVNAGDLTAKSPLYHNQNDYPAADFTVNSTNERRMVTMKQKNAGLNYAGYSRRGARQADRGSRNYQLARAGYPRNAETRKAARLARIMARMARDGETEELAEMIAEIMEPENAIISVPADVTGAAGAYGAAGITGASGASGIPGASLGHETPAAADPASAIAAEAAQAITGAVEQVMGEEDVEDIPINPYVGNDPVIVAVPEDRPITIDCGEEILALLRQISALLMKGSNQGMASQMDTVDPATGSAAANVPVAVASSGIAAGAPAAVAPAAVPVAVANPAVVPAAVPVAAANPAVAPAAIPVAAANPAAIPAAAGMAQAAVPAAAVPVTVPAGVPAVAPTVLTAPAVSAVPTADPSVDAVVEAITNAVNAAAGEPEAVIPDEDPVEALVAEALEEAAGTVSPDNAGSAVSAAMQNSAVADPAVEGSTFSGTAFVNPSAVNPAVTNPADSILSGILVPDDEAGTENGDQHDCGNTISRTEDALRAAMATFRPILQNMQPAARRQAVEKIASNIRAMDRRRSQARRAAGAKDAYALLKNAPAGGAAVEPTADLGRKIMESRNANYRR